MSILRMKLLCVAIVFLLCNSTVCIAQSAAEKLDYKPTPYMFVGLQGGAQTTFTDFKFSKLITPTASISFGAFFSPVIGARLHVNGVWNKSGIKTNGESNFTYAYKYLTTDLDLLVNLSTLIGKDNYYPLNVYLIGGIGLNYAWDADDLKNSTFSNAYAWKGNNNMSHNLRLGAMIDYNLNKHWSVNLELSANNLSDRYNCKLRMSDDWQLTAQVGVAYKFGFSKKVHTSPVVVVPVEEYVGDRNAETASAKLDIDKQEREKEEKPIVKLETLKEDVFFNIASAEIRPSEAAKIKAVVKWLEDHPKAVATITGHADAGTGNAQINARYARQRAEIVAKAIKDAGISDSRIKVESKGDKEMPYGDNEKSRVAIVLANEK